MLKKDSHQVIEENTFPYQLSYEGIMDQSLQQTPSIRGGDSTIDDPCRDKTSLSPKTQNRSQTVFAFTISQEQ